MIIQATRKLTPHSPHFFFIQKFAPISATKSTMRYEVYRNKNSGDEDFTVISDMYKRIMSEDKWLCANAQKNIQRPKLTGMQDLDPKPRNTRKQERRKAKLIDSRPTIASTFPAHLLESFTPSSPGLPPPPSPKLVPTPV